MMKLASLLLVFAALLFTAKPTTAATRTITIASGVASQYAPGIMERVAIYRKTRPTAYALPSPLPTTDGMIAVLHCEHIGETWLLRHEGVVETFLVVDCAGDRATREWMLRGNVIAEVDGATAARWGVVGRAARVERVVYVEGEVAE